MIPPRPIPPVAVVILNWNGRKMLERFLPDVIANTPADIADIVVADNGSDDDSVDFLLSNPAFADVRTILLDRNYGFAEGYNRAIDRIDSPYTVLLNSDVAPAKDWLQPLLHHMESHPDTAACQPKILSVDRPDEFEYAGACGGFLDRNGYPYCRGRIFSTVEKDNGQYDTAISVDWATGAALMVRTGLYRKAGGLDREFFAHMEEIDLCWRLRSMGYAVDVVPASTVYHLGGGSLAAGNPRKTYLNFRNNLLLLYKNLPAGVRRGKLFKRRLLDTLAFMKFAATGDFKNARAVVKAHRDFKKMRQLYDDIALPADNLLDKRPNILTKYYLNGKKRYSELKN